MVLQRHCEMDPAITRAERYVRQDPPRFQAARRGWVGEGNRSVPTGDSSTTPTEVRSVERSALVSSLSLDIMASIVRATCSSSPFLSAHNQIIPHTLRFFPVIASSLVSVCLPPHILIYEIPCSSHTLAPFSTSRGSLMSTCLAFLVV